MLDRITTIGLLAALCLIRLPAAAAAADDAAIRDALGQRMREAEAAGFSGSILVAAGDRIVFERSAGIADPATGAPVGPTTRFNLASTGKLFTTVAVLQLVQQGKLDLDAPVGRYLPDWPVARVRERVTPRLLLLHASGLGSFWGPEFEAGRAGLRTLADYRPLIATEPDFDPGNGFAYSNSGFLLLGLLVEAASGRDYYDYVAGRIFAPAGMEDSGYFNPDGIAQAVARPHRGGTDARGSEPLPMPEPRGASAGGGYSTPRDMLRFHRALTGGRLLDEPTLNVLFAPVAPKPGWSPPMPAGLGMLLWADGDDFLYAHPGGAPGIGSSFVAQRHGGWIFVAMSNGEQPSFRQLVGDLLALLAASGGPDLRPRPVRPRARAAGPA